MNINIHKIFPFGYMHFQMFANIYKQIGQVLTCFFAKTGPKIIV